MSIPGIWNKRKKRLGILSIMLPIIIIVLIRLHPLSCQKGKEKEKKNPF